MKPSLEFNLKLPVEPCSALIGGVLIIRDNDKEAGVQLSATSGLARNQFKGSWRLKGRGSLPPSAVVAPQEYSVSTQRLWMPNVTGVEGSFYAIAPFQVNLLGVLRGDFGVHFDANLPGSKGCIVIRNQDHWDIFRQTIAAFREAGYQRIPLLVRYY